MGQTLLQACESVKCNFKHSVLNFILRPYDLSFIKEMGANTTKGTDDEDLRPF